MIATSKLLRNLYSVHIFSSGRSTYTYMCGTILLWVGMTVPDFICDLLTAHTFIFTLAEYKKKIKKMMDIVDSLLLTKET